VILLIETTTATLSLGLVNGDGTVVGLFELDDQQHVAWATRGIQQVLAQGEIAIKDLWAVAYSRGPGSYTSLRVGLSTAKGICYALGLPLIGLDSMAILAEAAFLATDPAETLYLPMTDARRLEVYVAAFKNGQYIIAAHAHILTEASRAELSSDRQNIVLCGNGGEKSLPFFDQAVLRASQPSAAMMAAMALKAYKNKEFADVSLEKPFYLKPPNITVAKK
jgi:tRNA threonylcarbamoyladenosine biosynthesis protein TsaB